MGMKKQIFCIVVTCSFLFFSNFLHIDSIDVDWEVGDTYTYDIHLYEHVNEIFYQTDPDFEYDFFDDWVRKFYIVDINNETKVITSKFSDDNDSGTVWYHYYSIDEKISSDLSSITGLFDFNYEYDEDSDQIFIKFIWPNFDEPEIFLEPDWLKYNNAIKTNVLDESKIIDTVKVVGKTYQITFGEFLENLTGFEINGENTLSSAKEMFTPVNTNLSFYFDMKGIWKIGLHEIINATLDVNINYFDNGLLDYYEFVFDVETNDSLSSYKQLYEFIITSRGMTSNSVKQSIKVGYTPIVIFPVVLIMILLKTRRNKKNQ
jgi:hypothetical protein